MRIEKIKSQLNDLKKIKFQSNFEIYLVDKNNDLYNITNIGKNGKLYFEVGV